jgi:hypothetical protein
MVSHVAIQRRSLFGTPSATGSSGNGADQPPQIDPWTGDRNPSYKAPQPSAPLAADNGGDAAARAHLAALAADHRSASARYSGAPDADSNQTAGGAVVGRGDDDFHTVGHMPGQEFGGTTGGADPLTTRTDGADRGDTGVGKAI